LSRFTSAFIEASLRRSDGPVYYTDIANTLRDGFLGDDDQTPFFVNQGSGRELLVDDSAKLAAVKLSLREKWSVGVTAETSDINDVANEVVVSSPSTKDLLVAAEKRMGTPEQANALIGALFDEIIAKFKTAEVAEFFTIDIAEHKDFREQTAEEFMIRVLAREPRPDRLVTAEVERTKKKRSPWETSLDLMMAVNPDWVESFNLSLNCRLDRAQLRLTLQPSYRTLKQLKLVVSCAPSLEHCYVFEVATQHPRTDWESFDIEGKELVRRWYKLEWSSEIGWLATKICDGLSAAITGHIEETAKRISHEQK